MDDVCGLVPEPVCARGGLYFASIHWMQRVAGIENHPTALQSMTIGVCGRCLSGAIIIPFTVIKTRFEVIDLFYLFQFKKI